MATQEEPQQETAETQAKHEDPEALSLVDYFDQVDRAAFKRALEYRDSVFLHAADN
jgi:hypothetical protein